MTSAWDVAVDGGARLAEAGLVSPSADARILLAHVMGIDISQMLLAPVVGPRQLEDFEAMLQRRIDGEPVQHITGEAHFRYETLEVGPGVFIPRPETEVLVDLALQKLGERPAGRRRVVELCAGSGAISLSLVRELGGVVGHAVELSDDAIGYLRRNLDGTGVEVVHGDMADAFTELAGEVDVVVANPPYVPETIRAQLPTDVVGRDPDLALFSGPDGLDALHVVARRARELLRPGGWVLAEHDESHGAQVVRLFREHGFEDVVDHEDLTGRPRHVAARQAGADDMAGLGA